jgi:hypothetical protein
MNITKYDRFTNRELLVELDNARQYSPIIQELCVRLENIGNECPVCEADLERANKELE